MTCDDPTNGTREGGEPDELALTLAEEQAEAAIRRVWHEGRWCFSIIDMIGVVTDAPVPRTYWPC